MGVGEWGTQNDALVTHVELWVWVGWVWVGMVVLTIMFMLSCGSGWDWCGLGEQYSL